MKKSFLKLNICLILLSILLVSCKKNENITYDAIKDSLELNEDVEENLSLAELIASTNQLSLLTEALLATDLPTTLDSKYPITLFAPTNTAVMELFELLGDDYNSFEDFDSLLEQEILTRILTYHMVEGNLSSTDFVTGEMQTLYEGNTIEFIHTGDTFVISDASEIDAIPFVLDKKATDGTLHIIDKILIPQDVFEFLNTLNPPNTVEKTIKELIEENEEFAFLKKALVLTGLLDTLGEDGPFTIFAPSNNTLTGLLSALGIEFESLDDFNTEEEIDLLRDILLYHVVPGTLESKDFRIGPLVTLSDENSISIDENEDEYVLIDATTLSSEFLTTDIPAQNGIVHVIDRVLIPESLVNQVANSVSLAFERVMENAGELNTALEFFRLVQDRMNLEVLSEKEFTFFFPSDQAFVDLFNEIGYDKIQEFNNSEQGLEIVKIILSYHCVENQTLKSEDFRNGQVLNTFQGDELGILLETDIFVIDKTAKQSKLIYEDLEVLNGFIHVIDKVLLPQEVLDSL
ncbi:fasciclin domain-containing protein [Maribacter algarum]|nr:fasciclin domain-containing protein [Maribacter algarum]